MPQTARTESEIVAAQYQSWVYPVPVQDMAEAVAGGYWDRSDPSLFRRKLWPRKTEPDDLEILVAGCGTNQAACYAFNNRHCRVVGLDLSDAALGHEAYLKQKHGLNNLDLFRMSLGDVASLGRTFDLIVCTGVLHHLPDPGAGLRRLRDVLRPHGVMSVMVYGRYPRLGVYMMQEMFRVLGLRQDAEGVELVKRVVSHDVPAWHHLRAYMRLAPDLGYNSGLVDTFLHPLDHAYTVPEVLTFARANGLKLQAWLDKLDYSISASIMDPENPLRRRVEALPKKISGGWSSWSRSRWPRIGSCSAIPRGPRATTSRASTARLGSTTSPACARRVGSCARPTHPKWNRARRQPPGPNLSGTWWTCRGAGGAGTARHPTPSPRAPRLGHRRFAAAGTWPRSPRSEAELLEGVDGRRPIGELVGAASEGKGDGRSTAAAQDLFRRMAGWDHVLFRVP